MKLYTKILCQKCKKERIIDLSKSNVEKYKMAHPICQKCSTFKNKNKISKSWFKKGMIPWNKGIESTLKKINPGYDALHEWVETWAGKAKDGFCEKCGTNENMQWSNISGEYKRDLTDWQRFCRKCHCRYDFEKFGARKIFYT